MSGPVNIVVNGHRQSVAAGTGAGPGVSVQARRTMFERHQPADSPKTHSAGSTTTRQIVPRTFVVNAASTVVAPAPSRDHRTSATPSAAPSAGPSARPSATPSGTFSARPSATPSGTSSARPSATPSAAPSATPSATPSARPSAGPSATSSATPSSTPSGRQRSVSNQSAPTALTPTSGTGRPGASGFVSSSNNCGSSSGGGGGGGGGGTGGRSWFFGTDISNAPEGTIAVRLNPSSSQTGQRPLRQSASQPQMTPERRAQATVWDHLRSERSGVDADPALEAEARRLIAGAADPSPVGRRKKRICFARDSSLAETYEYQSERSLMDELQITPDYPAEPVDAVPPLIQRNLLLQQRKAMQAEPPSLQEQKSESVEGELSGKSAAPPQADIGSYQAKLAREAAFQWGASRATSSTESADAAQKQPEQQQSEQSQSQQQQQQTWSISATSDLLF